MIEFNENCDGKVANMISTIAMMIVLLLLLIYSRIRMIGVLHVWIRSAMTDDYNRKSDIGLYVIYKRCWQSGNITIYWGSERRKKGQRAHGRNIGIGDQYWCVPDKCGISSVSFSFCSSPSHQGGVHPPVIHPQRCWEMKQPPTLLPLQVRNTVNWHCNCDRLIAVDA